MGATECLTKRTYGNIEFSARVRALLRRAPPRSSNGQRTSFVDGELEVDLASKTVSLHGQPVSLTPTEFRLLACFLENVDTVLSPEELVILVWGSNEARPGTAGLAIRSHIHYLRQKIEPDPDHPQRIVTRWGKGYLFQRLAVD
jgi:two-component system KDP operon response regulator KdpE